MFRITRIAVELDHNIPSTSFAFSSGSKDQYLLCTMIEDGV